MNAIDLSGARARHAAATPGPWRWFGNTRVKECHLATTHSGRIYVLDFDRWGMQSAQPRFQINDRFGRMVRLADLEAEGEDYAPKWEVPAEPGKKRYRDHFVGIAHPDATFIERSWEDMRDALAVIDALAKAARGVVAHHRTPGDDCYVADLDRVLGDLGLDAETVAEAGGEP